MFWVCYMIGLFVYCNVCVYGYSYSIKAFLHDDNRPLGYIAPKID